MLTVALLALLTLLSVLLSADRAWENVTKPERNELVFSGRHHEYGAFVLRREYDRRIVWAFVGALGLFSAAIAVPKVMGGFGAFTVHVKDVIPPRIKEWVLDDPIIPQKTQVTQRSEQRHDPSTRPERSDNGAVVAADKDSLSKTPVVVDTLPPGPPDPGPGPGGAGPMPPGGSTGGGAGTELGSERKTWTLPEVKDYPEFVGGPEAMMRFVQNNIRFPDGDEPRYKAYIEFVVDDDGTVLSVRAKTKGRSAFDEAAERVVRIMPKWKPARLASGQEVPCMLVLPIEFRTQ